MAIREITAACALAVDAYGTQIGALEAYVTEAKKSVIFSVITRLSRLEFVLTTKSSVLCPPGTLFLRIYPQKNRSLCLHLYELAAPDDFRCTYFPYVENADRLDACFAALTAVLVDYMPVVEQLALEGEAYEEALFQKRQRIRDYIKVADKDIPQEEEEQEAFWAQWGEFYETFAQIARFTTHDGYAAFLSGQPEKAIKHYRKEAKKGQLTPYEERLYSFLHTADAHTYVALPVACAPILKGREQQYGVRQGLELLGMLGVLYAVLAPLFLLLAWGLFAIFCREAVYAPFDWVMALILPLLPAVFGAISLRRWLYPKLFCKNTSQWLAVDALENSPLVNRVCHWIAGILTVVCVYFNVVFTLCVPRVYADRLVFDDGAAFPLLAPQTYAYEDLKEVCYIEGRYNDFGDFIDRPSYVLFFSEGRVIDLDWSLTVEDSREQVLPLLEPYVDVVKEYPSDRALAEEKATTVDGLFGW